MMVKPIIQKPLIEVSSLTVDYWDEWHWVNIVDNVSFTIFPGETLGLAGESGCGKSTTAGAMMGYFRRGSRYRSGKVLFHGTDLLTQNKTKLTSIWGDRIGMVPQNPSMALTPTMRVGAQISEVLRVHKKFTGAIEKRVIEMLQAVRLMDAEDVARRYPHQLSGGQQQRIAIAMGLCCNPELLILDEPTTDLDVTTQAQIMNLLIQLQKEFHMSMLYVTHNLGVLAQITDRAAIMYAGKLVEVAPTNEIFTNPLHPYTQGLIASIPRIESPNHSEKRLAGFLKRNELPPGCRFSPRCTFRSQSCFQNAVDLKEVEQGHWVACSAVQ